jgi:hypothetical protein
VTSQNLLQDEVIEDNISNSIENDNSEDQLKQDNHTSLLPHVASAPVILNNIDIPTTMNDSNTSEIHSLGKELFIFELKNKFHYFSRYFSDKFIEYRKETISSMFMGNM